MNRKAPPALIADTQRWLERAVIGLNLCPFAKAVHVKGQIRYVVSEAPDTNTLLDELVRELQQLHASDPVVTDTTLLIIPSLLDDFSAFLDFVDLAEVSLRMQGLAGELQLAHFHPDYVFADAEGPDDLANQTNRSPWPTLHLIREASLSRATAAIPDAADIYERNIALARQIGAAGWQALAVGKHEGETP
ncbi:MAG: DUF1415 domain-containing protein [Rhodocyclaceae bacterium]|nr:DUF1415 domain-containing protein [Rhodocyclaceae bacterium]MBK6908414.1 DUF1415 domain-containing protein [Rhodocyclaceae bacterium]